MGAGQVLGQGGVRNVKPYVIIILFSLCVHRSPLGNEVKQERNLTVRKNKPNKKQ